MTMMIAITMATIGLCTKKFPLLSAMP